MDFSLDVILYGSIIFIVQIAGFVVLYNRFADIEKKLDKKE